VYLNGHGREFLGQGWNFPVELDGRGGLAVSGHDRDIEQAMTIILSTAKGERMMRPDFGSGIHDLIFAPYNATTAGLLAYHVQEALARWEPRIEVTNVDVQQSPAVADFLGLAQRRKKEPPTYDSPGVYVQEVDEGSKPIARVGTGDSGQIMIHIQYIVKSTNDERNLVYPFYLIPTEE